VPGPRRLSGTWSAAGLAASTNGDRNVYFVPNPGGGEPEYWRALMTAIKAAAQHP
jgi:hypothetical protein